MPAMATPSRTRQLKPAPACRTWFSTSPAMNQSLQGQYVNGNGALQVNAVIADAANPASTSGTSTAGSNIITVLSTWAFAGHDGDRPDGTSGTQTYTITGIVNATRFTVSNKPLRAAAPVPPLSPAILA